MPAAAADLNGLKWFLQRADAVPPLAESVSNVLFLNSPSVPRHRRRMSIFLDGSVKRFSLLPLHAPKLPTTKINTSTLLQTIRSVRTGLALFSGILGRCSFFRPSIHLRLGESARTLYPFLANIDKTIRSATFWSEKMPQRGAIGSRPPLRIGPRVHSFNGNTCGIRRYLWEIHSALIFRFVPFCS